MTTKKKTMKKSSAPPTDDRLRRIEIALRARLAGPNVIRSVLGDFGIIIPDDANPDAERAAIYAAFAALLNGEEASAR